uniref:Guanylate cyclase n=1 Tax=Heterodera glycines TaxID=51029 RepID=Q9GT36_HETGL|nr:guanylyl cyclase [Heterodera glycines]
MFFGTSVAVVLCWLFCTFPTTFGQQQNGTAPLIKVGLMMPHNQSSDLSFARSAGAISVALKHIFNDNLLPPGTNFSFIVRFEECLMSVAAGYAFDLLDGQQVDLFIAPPCTDSAQVALFVSTFYNIPSITWGQNSDSSFNSQSNYPTLLSALPNYADFGQIIISLCIFFKWSVMALIYQLSETGQCASFQQDLQIAINSNDKCDISYREEVKISSAGTSDAQYTISQIQSRARIVILCFDEFVQLRNFAAKLQEGGLDSADYVYLIPGLTMDDSIESVNCVFYKIQICVCFFSVFNLLFVLGGSKATAWWVDPNPTIQSAAYRIAQRSLYLMLDIFNKVATSGQVGNGTSFDQEVIRQVTQWPFFCTDCDQSLQASSYAPLLHDSFYLYAMALSKAAKIAGALSPSVYRNGQLIRSQTANLSFEGMTGSNKFGSDGLRNFIYLVSMYSSLNGDLTSYVWLQMNDAGVNSSWINATAEKLIWSSRNGVKPLAVPLCGFDGNGCHMDFFTEYRGYVIAAGCLLLLILGSFAFGIYWLFQSKAREMERQNRLWQIAYSTLTPAGTKKKMMESVRSLQSSTSSQFTRDSSHSHVSIKHNFNGIVYIMNGERVIGIQHSVGIRLSPQDMAELRTMRLLDGDNVNRFIGLSIDGAALLSLWRYCSRGPLSDVISGSSSLTMDGFFIYSLVRDVAEGLRFLHASSIGWYGNLRSTNCLIDDRWQIKLSEFGLRFFRAHEKREAKDLVWTAPELLRDNDIVGNKFGDVYSFSIVSSEIVNMKPIWEQDEAKGNVERVRTGGKRAFRPKLEPSSQDLSPALLHLIKDCWDESPAERPKMETVTALLQSMNTGRSTNLMDHVFNMLEVYAGSLEEEVEERTKELVEEKKKTDILLYRMLPKQVADKLKLGQSVEPETFDCVTVFFSDVVSFTTIASKCSPLQVVNLLNNLYTLLDSIIAEFDVYKVETIGDGYLCVSGLPHRNGHEHAQHIAKMSLAFMRNLGSFTIPHLPIERLRLRIGIHTGSTVAGVVGLSMPRYCLFGDTINTAARLESSSKPMRIHISTTTNHFLVNVLGGFVTQARGEILVKGKGVLETFWLLGLEGDPAVMRMLHSSDGNNATTE